jgi:hypothetical protein
LERNNLMKKILFFIIFAVHIPSIAQSTEGAMDCTVTGNVVVSSEEGKYKTYSGIQGGVKNNEILNLTYSVTSNSIYIKLKRDKTENNTVIASYLSSADIDTTAEKGKDGGIVLIQNKYNHSLSFLPDYIRINEFQGLVLSRYYKNDWHGIFTDVRPLDLSSHTLTLNCRHSNDKMDVAFKIFNSYKARK